MKELVRVNQNEKINDGDEVYVKMKFSHELLNQGSVLLTYPHSGVSIVVQTEDIYK